MKNNRLMDKELLRKYFENRYTDEELSSIVKWLDESSQTSQGKALLSELWEEISDNCENPETDFGVLYERIHNRLKTDSYKPKFHKEEHRTKRHIFRMLRNAAAFLLIPVLGFGLYMTAKYFEIKDQPDSVAYNEVYSSLDAITKITLPDGTNAWLNHRSSLRYPASFSPGSRKVELSGEGFFEVASNPDSPFIVRAGDVEVIATGTVFNVLAYPGEDRIETSLIEGVVRMQRIMPDGKVVHLAEMKPTDLVIYNRYSNEMTTRIINDDRYFSWKEGKLVFQKEPLGEVIKKLSRWFNVEIHINDERLYDLTFTGTFIDETLAQVLELIEMGSPVSYSISNRKEINSGLFSKRTVILDYKHVPRERIMR